MDYLVDSDRKSRLEALLKTCNLTSVVNFPTHSHKHTITAIDNIFLTLENGELFYVVCLKSKCTDFFI
jgi:hypothetical protein